MRLRSNGINELILVTGRKDGIRFERFGITVLDSAAYNVVAYYKPRNRKHRIIKLRRSIPPGFGLRRYGLVDAPKEEP